jgi:hypothetical protein
MPTNKSEIEPAAFCAVPQLNAPPGTRVLREQFAIFVGRFQAYMLSLVIRQMTDSTRQIHFLL